jgi:hypothetical protein
MKVLLTTYSHVEGVIGSQSVVSTRPGIVVVWDNRVDIQDWTIVQSFAIQSSDDTLCSTFSRSSPRGAKGCRATFSQMARHELLLPRLGSSARLIRV